MSENRLEQYKHPYDEAWMKRLCTFRETRLDKTIVTNYETEHLIDGVPMVRIERELPESFLENCSEERIRTRVRRVRKDKE